jgi:hypothetical protein
MHTRRVSAFLVGAWLSGMLVMWLVTGQSSVSVNRLLMAPPPNLTEELERAGPQASRRLLQHQSAELNRHLIETWLVIQLGIGSALVVISILTPHRSFFVCGVAMGLIIVTALQAFWLTPSAHSAARAMDALSGDAAIAQGEVHAAYAVWNRALEIIKALLGSLLAIRLLLDRYELAAAVGISGRRNHTRSSGQRSHVRRQIDSVDHADHRHIDG